MSESSSTPLKPSPYGVQGWVMMLPVAGLPVGLHAISGALFVGAGMVLAAAPIALPATVPFLFNAASKGGFESIISKIIPAAETKTTVRNAVSQKAEAAEQETEPINRTVVPADV